MEVYEEEHTIILLFESFLGRDIRHKVFEYASLSESQLAETLYRLLLALQHLHSRGIMHRDIKPENIILRNETTLTDLCLINFSTSLVVGDANRRQSAKMVGTPGYMAPEMFSQKEFDFKSDVFSLGVVFYFLCFSKQPFDGVNLHEVVH
jgi:serine/threonine protein kinase